MSGGVDSSVAAELLRRGARGNWRLHAAWRARRIDLPVGLGRSAGIDGFRDGDPAVRTPARQAVLPIVERAAHKQGCCTAADAEDARRVADRLNIPFYALDFQDEFGRIIDYFVAEYVAARTPNPCVVCNTWLKFGRLFDYADSVQADFVATGHYARIVPAADGQPALAVGVDESKDQSYALFGIDRRLLCRMLLPVGSYRKPEIRRLAQRAGFAGGRKKESQEICFVPEGDHAAFIRGRSVRRPRPARLSRPTDRRSAITTGWSGSRSASARGWAWHWASRGSWCGWSRRRGASGHRHESRTGPRRTDRRQHQLAHRSPAGPLRCGVKIRYNSRRVPATVEPLPGGRLHCRFDEPQFGVAPGQAVVCYVGEQVAGGGWIE